MEIYFDYNRGDSRRKSLNRKFFNEVRGVSKKGILVRYFFGANNFYNMGLCCSPIGNLSPPLPQETQWTSGVFGAQTTRSKAGTKSVTSLGELFYAFHVRFSLVCLHFLIPLPFLSQNETNK